MQAPSGIFTFTLQFQGLERAFPDGFYPGDPSPGEKRSESAPRGAAALAPNPRRLLVLDQGDAARPGPFAVAAALNYLREDGRRDPLSTRFLAAATEQVDVETDVDDGDGLGRALFVLNQLGGLGADVWPAEAEDAPAEVLSLSTFEERFRIDRVLQVRATRESAEAALAAKPALLVRARIHAGWTDPPGGVIAFDEQAEPLGVHAVCALGFDDDGLLVQSSWGPAWGGAVVDGAPRGGLARWSWADFERNGLSAWQIQLPPTEEFDPVVRPRAGYRSDEALGRDRLGIEREVEALAMVVASRDVQPPLSIGLFGDWGVGKSFFMGRLKTAVDELARSADEIEQRRHAGERDGLAEPAYWSQIAHIEFNAWHFADANLWASLVVRIFDGLAHHLAIKKDRLDQLDQERDELLKRLESEHAEVRRLAREHDAVEKKLGESQAELARVEVEVERERGKLERIDVGAEAARVWNERVRDDPRLREAVDELGLPVAVEGFAELRAGLGNVRGSGDRLLRRIGEVFTGGGPGRKVALAAIAVAGLAAPTLISVVVDSEAVEELLGRVSMFAAWIGGPIAVARGGLARLNASFRAIDDVLPDLRAAESPESHEEVAQQKARVDELSQRRDELSAEVAKRRAEVGAIEELLREHRVGRELYRFVETKAEDADYQAKLGIVSAIREDLQLLSKLLGRRGSEKRAAWGPRAMPAEPTPGAGGADIDRIVLYVDDLDRCAPDRVVEILQAVHLLLAFPLFVVVVAVDSRWLLRSLRKEYAEFLDVGDEDDEPERDRVPPSTPQDYLEKIFQIALSIKPMSKAGYDALLDDLIPPPVRVESAAAQEVDGSVARRPAHLPEGDAVHALAPFVELNPPSLDIPEREAQIMKRLDGFLATPRTVKRFVNTYRLLRASLERVELDEFEQPASSAPEAVLVLLAILTGFPELAERVFRGLLAQDPQLAWVPFLDGFELVPIYRRDGELSTAPKVDVVAPTAGLSSVSHYSNKLDARITLDEKDTWELLRALLGAFAFTSVDALRPWTDRVARYAIRPIQLEARS